MASMTGFGPNYNDMYYRLNQNRALGRPLRPEELYAMESARLSNERANNIANRQAEIAEKDRQDRLDLARQQAEAGKRGDMVKGLGQLYQMGLEGYDIGKKQGWWGKPGVQQPNTNIKEVVDTGQMVTDPVTGESSFVSSGGAPVDITQTVPSQSGGVAPATIEAAKLSTMGESATPSFTDMGLGFLEGNFSPSGLQMPTGYAPLAGTAGSSILPAIGMGEPIQAVGSMLTPYLETAAPANFVEQVSGNLVGQGMGAFAPEAAGTAASAMTPAMTALSSMPYMAGVGLGSSLGALGGKYMGTTSFGQGLTPFNDQTKSGQMLNASGGGAAGGAAAGAAVGSIVPGIGTGIGALVGTIVGGASGAAGEATVVCTALHSHGMISDEMYEADTKYGKLMKANDPDALKGYWLIFTPLAEKVTRSKMLAYVVRFFAMPVIKQIAHEAEPKAFSGSLVGDIMLKTGKAICRFIYRSTDKAIIEEVC